jgi:hypothetical protein
MTPALTFSSSFPLGIHRVNIRWKMETVRTQHNPVIPAQAGIQNDQKHPGFRVKPGTRDLKGFAEK